ncbi:hypothetical protein FBU30_005870 [Linnemannia zychae]|nr:hypothetical protein FBU30_005870 [Linnemannia zychae]
MSSRNNLVSDNDQDLPYPENETEYSSEAGAKEAGDHESFREYEYDSVTKPYQQPFYRRKKVIWTCLIGTIVFLAIFIPILILVIIPKVAQHMLDTSSMNILQLNMTNPGETAVTVSVSAEVGGIPKIFTADMDFTEKVTVSWKNQVIGSMSLTPVHVSKGKGAIQQSTTFAIENKDAFAAFAQDMLAADGFEWVLTSKATLKALGQTIKDLKVNKVLKMNGLANFSNLKILKFDLPADDPQGAKISIQASIANPSPIGMTLGTITLDMNFETAYLGRVVAKDVVLVPGQPMILNLEGILLKQTEQVHLDELSLLMSNYLGGIVTSAKAKGVSVFPDGANGVSWLTSAVTSMTMTVPLVAPEPLKVIQGLEILDMGLTVRPDNPWNPTTVSDAVSAQFKLPFNISINITKLANATMTLIYKGTPLADLTTAVWNQTSSDMANNKIVFTLPPSPLNVNPNAHEAFQTFLTEVVQNTESGFDIKGSADSIATTPLGIVRLKVPFTSTVALKGIGFATIEPVISNVTVIGGNSDHVVISANVGINNPSIFSVDAGPVSLTISGTASGVSGTMGDVLIPNLKFAPGLTTLTTELHFRPSDPALRDVFFSDFIAGQIFDCVINGNAQSTDIASMAPVLAAVTMKAKVPGIIPAPRLIVKADGAPSIGTVIGNRQIPLTVDVFNPLQTSFAIKDINANIFWEGNFFGNIKATVPMPVAASATVISPPLVVQAPSGFDFGLFMITTFLPKNLGVLTGANVNVDMVSNISVTVGDPVDAGYAATIKYSQNAVSAFLKLDIMNFKKRDVVVRAEPSIEESEDYLQWLKEALFASYPEEAKAYVDSLNA